MRRAAAREKWDQPALGGEDEAGADGPAEGIEEEDEEDEENEEADLDGDGEAVERQVHEAVDDDAANIS